MTQESDPSIATYSAMLSLGNWLVQDTLFLWIDFFVKLEPY